jgi:hypothetical protein
MSRPGSGLDQEGRLGRPSIGAEHTPAKLDSTRSIISRFPAAVQYARRVGVHRYAAGVLAWSELAYWLFHYWLPAAPAALVATAMSIAMSMPCRVLQRFVYSR